MLQNPQIHRVLVPLLIMTLNDFKFACVTHLIHNSIVRKLILSAADLGKNKDSPGKLLMRALSP